MLLCLEDDYESPDEQSDKKKKDKDRRFQWNHGRELIDTVQCKSISQAYIFDWFVYGVV